MFDLDEAIKKWLKTFRKGQAFNHGSIREMELHLRDHIDDLVSSGCDSKKAFETAVKEFGDINTMAREEYTVLAPEPFYLSIINVTMIKNYFKIALRNFMNHKFYALINISGLTVGLSVVFFIGLFVLDELSFDRFNIKVNNLYRVVENQYYADQPVFPVAVTPSALGPALKEKYPEIINSARVQVRGYQFELNENKAIEKKGIVVDRSFFDMFSYPLIAGSFDDFEKNTNALILDETLAKKYFPETDNPVGKIIKLNDTEYMVTGVMAKVQTNSHLDFEYVTNFKSYEIRDPDRANSWKSNWLYTYVETTPEINLTNFNEKIRGLIKANNAGSVVEIYLQQVSDIYLGTVDFVAEVSRKGNMGYVKAFSLVAVFILLISCINFMNLSTAKSARRAKEVGLRKAIGAERTQLIFQFLSESMFFTLMAVFLSLFIVSLLLPSFNILTNKEFDLMALFSTDYGLKITLGILFIAFFTGIVAGSYPALYLSAVKPIETIVGKKQKIKGGTLIRKGLVIIQFVISVMLIIGTAIVYTQLQFIQNIDLGYNKENILYTMVPNEKARLFTNEVRQTPGVISAGLADQHPAHVENSSSGVKWAGQNPDEDLLFHFLSVDENYLKTMEIELIRGRHFTATDSNTVIINQKAMELMGIEDPIGQGITYDSTEYTITGVVKDFNFKSIHTKIEPLILFKSSNVFITYIRYEESAEASISEVVKEVHSKVLPFVDFDRYFLEDDFNDIYMAEQRTGTLALLFTSLAVLISCLGLLALASYAAEQRTKEIGIRKVMGASLTGLFLLLSGDFVRLVLSSLLISIPLSWFFMNKWLEGFAYRADVPIWIYVLSGLLALGITIVTVSYQTLRASVQNPVHSLKCE